MHARPAGPVVERSRQPRPYTGNAPPPETLRQWPGMPGPAQPALVAIHRVVPEDVRFSVTSIQVPALARYFDPDRGRGGAP